MRAIDQVPFWRARLLTPAEQELLAETLAAHGRCVLRDNISSVTLRNAAIGSHDFVASLCSAMLTTGGLHAPLEQTYELLSSSAAKQIAQALLDEGLKVPGWGSSFVKERKDPAWLTVDALLRRDWPDLYERMDEVTHVLYERGKRLFPNPSAYTAACAICLELPARLCVWIFVAGRLEGWAEEFNAILNEQQSTFK